jgi:uncharacterized protein (DUF2062 family)
MLRNFIHKLLPKPKEVRDQVKQLWLRHLIHDQNLWHINRRSISGGVAIGLFVAFIPLPLQMLIATILAIICRVNVPIAIVATWITNPFTFIPINYAIYMVGNWVIGSNHQSISKINECHFVWGKYTEILHQTSVCIQTLGKAFLVGLPIVAAGAAVLGFILVRIVWRIAIMIYKYRRIKKNRLNKTHN